MSPAAWTPGLALLSAWLAPAALALPLPAQESTDPASPGASQAAAAEPLAADSSFEVLGGLGLSRWAESPLLFNPTAMDVDGDGRVWVTQAVNYRSWKGSSQAGARAAGDSVVVLEDSDGDGAADRRTVFAQGPELVTPLGLCVLPGGRVLVSCSPDLWLYEDLDGDLVADRKERVLSGFGGRDHDHGLHSAVPDYAGGLLLVAGNAGPHVVTDPSGWTLRSSSMFGRNPAGNPPGRVSDDGRVYVGGLVLQLNLDGDGLGVWAHNFRNPYEVAMDAFGRVFGSDNDDDGNRACRTLQIAQGGSYGYYSPDGSRGWKADQRPGQDRLRAHWRQDDPGVFPPGTINGAGGPTGVCIYEAGLPSDPMYALNGAVLNADAGAGKVYAHLPLRKGAGTDLQASVLIGRRGDERSAAWFRPSDVCVAPDGSILVADWFDPAVGGHGTGDRAAYGRILRLQPEDQVGTKEHGPLTLPPWDGPAEPFDKLLDGLVSPAPAPRLAAHQALAAAGEAAFDALHDLAGHPNPHQAARPLWLLARLGERGTAFVEQLFHQPLPELRLAAWNALAAAGAITDEHRARCVRDEDPMLRAATAPLLREQRFEDCGQDLLALALLHPGSDRSYLEAVGLAAEGKELALYDALRESLGGDAVDWLRFAPLAWRLHPAGREAELLARVQDSGAPLEERQLLLEALAFIPSRPAAEALLNLSLAGPRELRPMAAYWSRRNASTLWRAFDLNVAADERNLETAVRVYQSPVLRGGSVPIRVEGLDQASRVWLVVNDAGDGHGCDWASWIELAFEGDFGRLPLSEQPWLQASSGWGEASIGANCGGGPLIVDDQTYTDGIGVHANSSLCFAVPPGTRALVGLAGPDAGGLRQGCGSTMTFEVHLEDKGRDDQRSGLSALVRDAGADLAARTSAALALAESPEGGFTLVALAQQDKLPQELRERVAAKLHGSSDYSLRALASGLFPRADAAVELPSIPELAALPGDRIAGQAVFLSATAGCSNCHRLRGRGGDVGPDLGAIHEKYGRAELLDAILNPSAAIAHGYETWLIETVDGVLLAGRILADGEDLLLQDSAGRRHVLAAAEIAARHEQQLSSMPDNAALGLQPEQLSDLASFLLWEPPLDPQFGPAESLLDADSLAGWIPYLRGEDSDPAQTWSIQDGVLRCTGRPAGYLRTEATYDHFELRLQWRFDPKAGPGNSGVLLRTLAPDKVWPRSIEAQLQHQNAGDIWNIDAVPMWPAQERTKGRRTAKLRPSVERPLGEWNDYRIRLVHGELTLEVNGVVQNRASWCDETPGSICLQSEGAVIEFRNITLRQLVD